LAKTAAPMTSTADPLTQGSAAAKTSEYYPFRIQSQ